MSRDVKRVVVERDYSEGLCPRFLAGPFPDALCDRMTREDFERVIGGVNALLRDAEEIRCATVAEGCCAYLTCFLSPACVPTQYERCLARVERFLHEQNDYFFDYGVEWLSPVPNGLLHLDILLKPTSGRALPATSSSASAAAAVVEIPPATL